jgi:Flp pilus assembly protein TadG
MRILRKATIPRRRGKVIVFMAILLPALMAFMSLAVDVSIIAAAWAHLNTAADAGALAGAMKLADDIRVLNNPSYSQAPSFSTEITATQAAVKATAQFNLVLNGALVFLSNANKGLCQNNLSIYRVGCGEML